MKKILLLTLTVLGLSAFNESKSQVRLNININAGIQPEWGPAGYDYVDYYYMPDIDVYYSVPDRQYIYFNDGRWVFSYSLPHCYDNYDLYRGYKVVINEPRPYLNDDYYRERFANRRGWYGRQEIIYNHQGNGYEGERNNRRIERNEEWEQEHGNGRGWRNRADNDWGHGHGRERRRERDDD